MESTGRPLLALVSTGIRRDLIEPLRYFSRFDLIHLYRFAEYGDMTDEDCGANLRRYNSPLGLYRQLLSTRPVIIQGVEPFSLALQPYLWACYLAARRTGAALVAVSLENRPLESKFGRLLALPLRAALHFYFSRTRLVIALNKGSRRNVLSCGVAPSHIKELMWGTWGVDSEEFSPRAAEPQHPPTILFAGRLQEEKGIFVLLDAFARVRARILDAHLLIVGGGPARTQFERRIAALSIGGVSLTGTIKHRDMPDVFRSADVVAMPSLTTRKWEEQVGMVALQAMACGTPLVASRSGAIPEYVPDGLAGLLVAENDANALADALVEILSDNGRRAQFGRAGRAYAIAHYDARTNVARAEQVLQESCLESRV